MTYETGSKRLNSEHTPDGHGERIFLLVDTRSEQEDAGLRQKMLSLRWPY